MSNQRSARRAHRWLPAAALAPLLLGASLRATAADSGAPSLPGKERAVTLESVAGSPIKRVVLVADRGLLSLDNLEVNGLGLQALQLQVLQVAVVLLGKRLGEIVRHAGLSSRNTAESVPSQ